MKKALLVVTMLLVLIAGSMLDTKAEETMVEVFPVNETDGKGSEWTLPYFEGDGAVWDAINEHYTHLSERVASDSKEAAKTISYEIAHLSDRYLSVVLTISEQGGNGEHERFEADTFALDSVYKGQKISLSQLLGMEETMPQEPTAAAELVWNLVWQIVAQETENPQSAYLDGIAMPDVQNAFQPESDFYLDENGNVVFWIPAGELAGEMAGVLFFPFAPGELMIAVGEG